MSHDPDARLLANINGCADCGRVVGEKHVSTCPTNLRLEAEARKRTGATDGPPVVLGNRGYETDAAGKAIEDEASKIARNCMADAVAMQACKWAADMSEDERGKLLATLFNAERGEDAWTYERREVRNDKLIDNRRLVLTGSVGTVTIGLDEPEFVVRDRRGNLEGRLLW